MKDWSILLKSIHQKRPRTRVNEEDNDAVHKWDLSFIPGPRVAAIVSIIETCRRLSIPVRDYLGSVLPGLADFPINRIVNSRLGLGQRDLADIEIFWRATPVVIKTDPIKRRPRLLPGQVTRTLEIAAAGLFWHSCRDRRLNGCFIGRLELAKISLLDNCSAAGLPFPVGFSRPGPPQREFLGPKAG